MTEGLEDIDTELKAVCYDITVKNGSQAIKSIEKIRRKLKAMEGKVKTLSKIENVENCKLSKETMELKKEINSLNKIVEELEDDSFLLSFEDQPSSAGPSQDSATLASSQDPSSAEPCKDIGSPEPSGK